MYDVRHSCENVIARIKEACESQLLSIRAAALRADVSPSAMYKLMDGSTIPYLDTLLKICNALGLTVSDLLDEPNNVRGGVAQRAILRNVR